MKPRLHVSPMKKQRLPSVHMASTIGLQDGVRGILAGLWSRITHSCSPSLLLCLPALSC